MDSRVNIKNDIGNLSSVVLSLVEVAPVVRWVGNSWQDITVWDKLTLLKCLTHRYRVSDALCNGLVDFHVIRKYYYNSFEVLANYNLEDLIIY